MTMYDFPLEETNQRGQKTKGGKPMPKDSYVSEFIHKEDELKYKAMNVIDQRKFFKEMLDQKRVKLIPVYG